MKSHNKLSNLLIIFDFDGVLADSKDAYAAQMKETIEKLSNYVYSIDVFKERIGNTEQKEDFAFFLQTKDEAILTKAVEVYRELTPKYEHLRNLYPGVRKIIKDLHSKYITGIVSRKRQSRMEYWLSYFNIREYFDYPIGTVEDCKSHAIRRIMNHYKISIDRTLMIGDTEFDMQGAKEAGVISVAAMYGSSKPEELSKMQPDFSISSPTQIYDVIDEIVNEDYSPTHI